MRIDPVTRILLNEVDRELSQQIRQRYEAMLNEMRFLESNEDLAYVAAIGAGWTNERLCVLCGLNSFYQIVLGPLLTSTRGLRGPLRDVPVLYGETLRFDRERGKRLNSARFAFFEAINTVPLPERVVTAPHLRDMVVVLAELEPRIRV